MSAPFPSFSSALKLPNQTLADAQGMGPSWNLMRDPPAPGAAGRGKLRPRGGPGSSWGGLRKGNSGVRATVNWFSLFYQQLSIPENSAARQPDVNTCCNSKPGFSKSTSQGTFQKEEGEKIGQTNETQTHSV